MSQAWSSVARFGIALVCQALSGCFSTNLPRIEFPEERFRLLMSAEASIALNLHPSDWPERTGLQYILGIIPFARIYTPEIAYDLEEQLSIEAATHGYRLVSPQSTSARTPSLDVELTDVSVSGYDLIFMRRPSASVRLHALFFSAGTLRRGCDVEGSSSTIARYAFSSDLNRALYSALEDGTQKLFSCLQLRKQ